MGCGNAKKEIENQIMIMKLERANIQMERANNLKILEQIEGCKREIKPIPDYIDPKLVQNQKNNKNNSENAPLIKGGIESNFPKRRTTILKKRFMKRKKSKRLSNKY